MQSLLQKLGIQFTEKETECLSQNMNFTEDTSHIDLREIAKESDKEDLVPKIDVDKNAAIKSSLAEQKVSATKLDLKSILSRSTENEQNWRSKLIPLLKGT